MGNIFQYNETELLAFILVLVRVGTFIGLWPVLGGNNFPANVKLLLSLMLSLVLFPGIGWQQISVDIQSNVIVWLVAREIAVGLVMVFISKLMFQAVSVAGEIISISMGLSSAQAFNPVSGTQSSVISQFQLMLVSVFFLSFNGHHLFITGLTQSFELVPLGSMPLDLIHGATLAKHLQLVAEIGLKLSGPVLASLFVMNIAMAIVGRTVPQLNILITSFPINIMIGFLVLIVTIPAFLYGFRSGIDIVMTDFFSVLKSM